MRPLLDHGGVVSPRLARAVEGAARRVGLPLGTLDLLTQDPAIAQAFLAAEARGQARDFLARLDVPTLQAALAARDRRADDDPPPGATLVV